MSEHTLSIQTLDVNGLRMQVALQGNGPLVLLCHGFPELWVSWRAQLRPDVGASIRRIHFGASGEWRALLGRPVFGAVAPDKGFLGRLVEPPALPEW